MCLCNHRLTATWKRTSFHSSRICLSNSRPILYHTHTDWYTHKCDRIQAHCRFRSFVRFIIRHRIFSFLSLFLRLSRTHIHTFIRARRLVHTFTASINTTYTTIAFRSTGSSRIITSCGDFSSSSSSFA